MVASKFTTDLKKAQAEIEDLVCRTLAAVFYYGFYLILPPTETRVRSIAGPTRNVKGGKI